MAERGKVFPLGQWLPDKADLDITDGVDIAQNVVPTASGYGPFKTYGADTDALDARPRGAARTRDAAGAVYQFAGDETKLYQNVANVWTDRSLVAGTAIELTGLGTSLGDLTGGGNLAAAFDDTTNQASAACATKASATTGYIGKTLVTPVAISKAVVYGSNDAGYITGANPNITLTLYGKTGIAPASATDGTVIGTLTAFADTANESGNPRTITASDDETVWTHVWVKIDQSGSAATMSCAEVVLYSRNYYATASEDGWEFARWYDTLIATNYTDNPQTITLGGSAFTELTTALRIKHIAVVRDFVVGGWTEDSGDGDVPWRVRWCGFKDPTSWTVSATTLADYEDLPQRRIQRIFGGEYGVIMQDEAVYRMTFVGAPLVFQFDEVLPDLGLMAPGLATRAGDVIYFLSAKGFFALSNGAQARPIGVGRVDQTTLSDIDRTALHRCSSVSDPVATRVYFSYPGQGSTDGRPNRILCYDWALDKWSYVNQELELLWVTGGTATTLEGIDAIQPDLDALDSSLDSSRWIGGADAIAMFDSTFHSGFFDGANMEATIRTQEFMFSGEARARIHGFRPLVEGGNVAVQGRVGTRNDVANDPSFTDLSSPRTGGRITCRTNARYHRFEVVINDDWLQAYGLMVDGKDIGSGGRRG